MSGKNICIIGAGIGGLTAGALLTKKGYNVKIFERELLIGGRALSFNMSDLTFEEYKSILTRFNMNIPFSVPDLDIIFNKKMFDGYKLDLGYHTIGGGSTSKIGEVLSVLGKNVDFFNSHIGFIDGYRVSTRFLSWFDRVMILPKILRLLFASERIMTQLDTVSMTETIKKYGQGKMKLILEIFSRSITTVNNLDRISTGEMFRAQKNLYKRSRPVGYPRGGLSNITQQLAEYIIENGGEIHLGKPINKIIIKNNKATGVFIDDEEHNFDVIISDILVKDFFNTL